MLRELSQKWLYVDSLSPHVLVQYFIMLVRKLTLMSEILESHKVLLSDPRRISRMVLLKHDYRG